MSCILLGFPGKKFEERKREKIFGLFSEVLKTIVNNAKTLPLQIQ